MSIPYRIDEHEIRRAWAAIIAPGQVTELRVLHARVRGEYRTGTYSGYFDGIDSMIDAIRLIEFAPAIYFLPNPCKPALLARSHNRARMNGREPTTSDHDIAERRWLLIDVDAVRPSGISATAAEKDAALEVATMIHAHLHDMHRDLPPGILADSGNGGHVMVPITLPTESDIPCRMLHSLAEEFDTSRAKIDITVCNPARIWKLPGTPVCKGDHAPQIGRIWRMARMITSIGDDHDGA